MAIDGGSIIANDNWWDAAYLSQSLDGDSDATATPFDVWDEANHTALNPTDHLEAQGITHDQATGRFTMAAIGKYKIGHMWILQASSSLGVDVEIRQNGAQVKKENLTLTTASQRIWMEILVETVAANEYVEFVVDEQVVPA